MKKGRKIPTTGWAFTSPRPYVQRRGFNNRDLGGPRVLHGEPYQADDLFLFDGNADQVIYIIPSERLVMLS